MAGGFRPVDGEIPGQDHHPGKGHKPGAHRGQGQAKIGLADPGKDRQEQAEREARQAVGVVPRLVGHHHHRQHHPAHQEGRLLRHPQEEPGEDAALHHRAEGAVDDLQDDGGQADQSGQPPAEQAVGPGPGKGALPAEPLQAGAVAAAPAEGASHPGGAAAPPKAAQAGSQQAAVIPPIQQGAEGQDPPADDTVFYHRHGGHSFPRFLYQ